MKQCTKCLKLKEDFYKDLRNSDGLRSYCKDCFKKTVKDYGYVKKRNENHRNYDKGYYLNNKDIIKHKKHKRYKNNPQKERDRVKNYKIKNIEKVKEANKLYRTLNRELLSFNASKRHCDLLKRTPKWANLNEIKEIYKNCPSGHQVDHIVPLRGRDVSGLHVEYNLQYLTKSANCRKGNRY